MTAMETVFPARKGNGNQNPRSFPCHVHGLKFGPDMTEDETTEAFTLACSLPSVDSCASIGGATWNFRRVNRGIRAGGQDPEAFAGR
jgi:hypothetical protein